MKKYIVYIILTFSGFHCVSGQEALIQWTGVVRNDLLEPIPYVHILVTKDWHGTVSDPNGMFTIVTFPKDTLWVSCIGYKTRKILVPQVSDSKHYIQDIILDPDTVALSEVVIFPWKTYKEFKDAVMALVLPEDDMIRAYHNIAVMQEQINNIIATRPATPTTNFRDVMAAQHNKMMGYGHVLPTYSITNPFAWLQFLEAIRNGEFKRRETKTQKPSILEEYTDDPDQ